MQKTVVYGRDSVERSLKFVISELAKFAKFDSRPLLLHDTSAGVCTQLKSVLSIKCGSAIDALILEHALNSALSAESRSPYAFQLCIQIINDNLVKRARGNAEFNYEKELSDSLASGVAQPSGSDVLALSERFFNDDIVNLRRLFLSTVELAGANGTVIIERAPAKEVVELVMGYVFELSPMINVSTKFIEPRTAFIDGYVESVSEIHSLLEAAAVTKEPILMFVRGMSQDVQHTLAVNYTRGSLQIVPICVQFDTEGINTLKDLAIIAGSDVTSSAKGDLISSLTLDSLTRIEKATVHGGKLILVNQPTIDAVGSHVNSLKKLREDKNVEALATLYDKRIKSLSPRHVTVRLKDDIEFIRRSQALDYAFRGVRSLRDHGMITFNTPVSSGRELTMTAYAAVQHAMSFLNMMSGVGSVVVND